MPGMAMAPLRVALRERAGRYRGVITLPMFGAYVARVVLVAERGIPLGPAEMALF